MLCLDLLNAFKSNSLVYFIKVYERTNPAWVEIVLKIDILLYNGAFKTIISERNKNF